MNERHITFDIRGAPEMTFVYLNHRNEIAERRVRPYFLEFGSNSDYYPQPQWLLTGYDLTRNETRTFSLSRIVIK